MLLDGQWRQALASARVFGRAGLKVGVATSPTEDSIPLATYSRWCNFATELPDPAVDAEGFGSDLMRLLETHPSDVVLPFHDGSIEVIRAHRSEIERLAAIPLASEAALNIAVDKKQTLALAEGLGIATPRRVTLDCESDIDAAVREIGLPCVIKPDRSWVSKGIGGIRLASVLVQTIEEARAEWSELADLGVSGSLQEWLPGRRDAISFFAANGQIFARFAQTSYREFPPLGGASVLCESIPLLEDIAVPAERLVKEIGLEGCSMVEFRRDAQGKPILMELNPRMAGSVSLAISCGVNFPGLSHAWAMGLPLVTYTGYPTGKRSRWLAGDFWNLKYSFDSSPGPDTPGHLRALTDFLADFVRRPSAIDPFDLHDPKPSLAEMHIHVLSRVGGRLARLGRRSMPHLVAPILLMELLSMPGF